MLAAEQRTLDPVVRRAVDEFFAANVEWLAESLQNKGMDFAAGEFMQRFFYDENLPWLGRAIEDLISQMPPRAWDNA